jgi:hypothetical protein
MSRMEGGVTAFDGSSAIESEVWVPAEIGPAMRRRMFELMNRYYEAIDEIAFASDMLEKNVVIILKRNEEIVGFTTASFEDLEVAGRPIRLLFSGDTIVVPELWGPGYIMHTSFRLAGNLKASRPDLPLYWLLVVMSHRTYRILSTFFRDFVPRIGKANDGDMMVIRDMVARRRFERFYDPATGLIDFGESRGHLRAALQNEEEKADGNRIVREFMSLNPHCARGVELACLAELSEQNLRSYARERFLEGLHEGPGVFSKPGLTLAGQGVISGKADQLHRSRDAG